MPTSTTVALILSSFLQDGTIDKINLYNVSCSSITENVCTITESVEPLVVRHISVQKFAEMANQNKGIEVIEQRFNRETNQTKIFYLKRNEITQK